MAVSQEEIEQHVYSAFANSLGAINLGLYQGALERKWQMVDALPESLQDGARLAKIADIFAEYETALVQSDDVELRGQVEQAMLGKMRASVAHTGVQADSADAMVQCLYVQQLAVNYSHLIYVDYTAGSDDIVDAEGLTQETAGIRALLHHALVNFGELAPEVADALIERHERDVRANVDLLRTELSQQEEEYEIPDTGWYDNYQPLIQDILDATRDARFSLRNVNVLDKVHARLEAMQDQFDVPQEEVERVTEQTREWMFRHGVVDPAELREFITKNAPKMALSLSSGDEVISDLIMVSGMEVMMHGLTQTIMAQYCDTSTLKPQHVEAENSMREEFQSMLDGLGMGKHAANVMVSRFAKAVHAATQHEMGLDEVNHYQRLN